MCVFFCLCGCVCLCVFESVGRLWQLDEIRIAIRTSSSPTNWNTRRRMRNSRTAVSKRKSQQRRATQGVSKVTVDALLAIGLWQD